MSFSCVIRSRDRISGDANSFNVQLAEIPKGNYKATFVLTLNTQVSITELQTRWAGMQTNSSSKSSESVHTILLCDGLRSYGQTYFTDPGSDVQISYNDVATNSLSTTMPETVITVFFEQI